MYFPLQTTGASQDMWPTDVSTTSFPLWLRHEADKDDTVEMDAMAIRVWSKWLLLTSWLYVNYAMGVTWTIWRFVMPSNLFKFPCRFHLKEFDPECDLYLPTLEMHHENKHTTSRCLHKKFGRSENQSWINLGPQKNSVVGREPAMIGFVSKSSRLGKVVQKNSSWKAFFFVVNPFGGTKMPGLFGQLL